MIYQQFVTLATAVFQLQQLFLQVPIQRLDAGLAVTSPRDAAEARSLAPQTPASEG